MVYINPDGHNWGLIIFDDLSKLYISVISVWTAFVASALYGLFYNRHLPFVRMRNVWLLIGSVTSLHIYLVMVFIVYPLNGTFSCQAEYWIMSVYFPIGVALFQLQNMVLFSQSLLQEELIWNEHEHTATVVRALRNSTRVTNFHGWLEQMSAYQKTRTSVVIGLALQVNTFWAAAAILPYVL